MQNFTNSKKNELETLRRQAAEVQSHSDEQIQRFNDLIYEIDLRMKVNNKKSDDYVGIKKNKPAAPETLAILGDILSEHVQINYLKFVHQGEVLDDLYKRVKLLGKSLDSVVTQIETLSEKVTALSVNSELTS